MARVIAPSLDRRQATARGLGFAGMERRGAEVVGTLGAQIWATTEEPAAARRAERCAGLARRLRARGGDGRQGAGLPAFDETREMVENAREAGENHRLQGFGQPASTRVRLGGGTQGR